MKTRQAWETWMDTIKTGDISSFEQGLKQGLSPIEPPSEGQFQHWPALAEAISRNQTDIAHLIIDWCKIHFPAHIEHWRCYAEGRHHTYLHLAARFQHAEIVQSLVDAGLSIDQEDWSGWPASWHCGNETLDKGNESIHQARCIQTFQAFVHAGSKLSTRLSNGWTLIEYSLRHHSPEFFQCVLESAYTPNLEKELKKLLKYPISFNSHVPQNLQIIELFLTLQHRQALDSKIPKNFQKSNPLRL